MKNIFEILETEGRVYITDFELASALGLDLGDIVGLIETTSQQRGYESKLDGKYILDREALKCLFPSSAFSSSILKARLLYVILKLRPNIA